jgi:phospholipase/lecithinase/hemolysin
VIRAAALTGRRDTTTMAAPMSTIPRSPARQRFSAISILACCLSFLLATTAGAQAQDSAVPLVVFGDSLSDSGNGFALQQANATPLDFGLNSVLIPQAAYAIGGHHLTNGATWIEQLAARFRVGSSTLPAFASTSPAAMNFAIATARAREDGTNPSLAFQIGAFLQKTRGVAPPGALYVIQIGGNDIRDALALASADPIGAAATLQSAAGAIGAGIARLHAAGARHFLVWNIASPGLTPAVRLLEAQQPGAFDTAVFAAALFNGFYLPGALGAASALPGIVLRRFDADGLLSSIFLFPGLFGLTNVTDACVTPGVAPFMCRAPDRYLFWDGIHPTTAAHALIARAVAQLFGY